MPPGQNIGNNPMFHDCYCGKKVLVTGHTGFKGSWLCAWLEMLGAEICGAALPMTTEFVHNDLLQMKFRSEMCDIRDVAAMERIFQEFQPEIVFHLAAQPLVRRSYLEPLETFESNVMGTANVLECCRRTPSVRAVVAISSDKCYENKERMQGYCETDPMGGYDPYSASKGCTELVIGSWRRSFFPNEHYGTKHHTLLASARAGNVIGGGDWAEDRLVPDLMRAAAQKKITEVRNPASVRPWQHVLEPLSGYLLLGEKLLQGKREIADGWNFGPAEDGAITVEESAAALAQEWDAVQYCCNPPADAPHEAGLLRLDCSKARRELQWYGVLTPAETFAMTAEWYRKFYTDGTICTREQIRRYGDLAAERNLEWTK